MSIGLGNKLLYFIKMVVTGFGSSLGETFFRKGKECGIYFSCTGDDFVFLSVQSGKVIRKKGDSS